MNAQDIAQNSNLIGGLLLIGVASIVIAFIAYKVQQRPKRITEEKPFTPLTDFPKPPPKIETKPMTSDPVLEKRLVEAGVKQPQTHVQPPSPEMPTLGVGAGFKFGFGFAAGVCVFMILASIVGWILVGALIMSTINGMQHSLLMPAFH